MDFPTLNDWIDHRDIIVEDAFHFRTKNNSADLRLTDEIYIQNELVKMFYGS